MTANVGTSRKVYVTIEVANAIGNYMHFMDAGAGAYSNEMALKGERRPRKGSRTPPRAEDAIELVS